MLALSDWGTPAELCKLDNEEITESSGIAPSWVTPDAYYTHNDSGDTARFFRFTQDGKVDGIFNLAGVGAVDWESMSTVKIGRSNFVYLCDVGDNARKREFVTIYRAREPIGESKAIEEFLTLTVTYPDAPHDCEAVFAEPGTANIWLVTKAREGVTYVYRINDALASGEYEAEALGTLPVDTGGLGGKLVTGGEASPDSSAVILRTYTGALEYAIEGDFEEWTSAEPTAVTLAKEKQGEAICYSTDGGQVLTSSEGQPCPVTVLKKRN
jgi:hypothetical protein